MLVAVPTNGDAAGKRGRGGWRRRARRCARLDQRPVLPPSLRDRRCRGHYDVGAFGTGTCPWERRTHTRNGHDGTSRRSIYRRYRPTYVAPRGAGSGGRRGNRVRRRDLSPPFVRIRLSVRSFHVPVHPHRKRRSDRRSRPRGVRRRLRVGGRDCRVAGRRIAVVAPANPLRSVSGDAAYVASVVNQIPGPVLIVGHSYGGVVITNVATQMPNAVGLVYVCAFLPDVGGSGMTLAARATTTNLGPTRRPPKSPNGTGAARGRELNINT